MLMFFIFISMLECGFQFHKVSDHNSILRGVIAWAEALAHGNPYYIIVKLSLKQVSATTTRPCTVCGVTHQATWRPRVLGRGLQNCLPIALSLH